MTDPMVSAAPTAATGTPVLAVNDVKVYFGGVRAVDGVTLSLEPGLLYGIMGPNGSGKSTLLAAVTRLLSVTAGTIHIEGHDITRTRPERLAALGVARTFQTTRLLPTLTIIENVALGADVDVSGRRTRAQRQEHDERVEAAMERTGVTRFAQALPDELSYGSQRRVEIARALAMSPRLLLLDEPTAGMNADERNEIGELLVQLRVQGVSQVLVEHDVPMMVDVCDQLIAMVQGRVVGVGDPAVIIEDPTVRSAYLGKRGAADA